MDNKQQNPMKRNIIIAAVALLVVAALLVVFLLLPDAGQTDPSASPSESVQPVETHYLINEQFTKLDSIKVYDASDKLDHTLLVTQDTDSDGNRLYAVEPSREGWNYDQSAFRASAINASTMSALSLVAENPGSLTDYGLDKPIYRIAISFDSGARKYEITVGGETALGNSYYCSNGDGNVYAVGMYAIGQLVRNEMSYRTYEFFPDYYDQESLEVVTNGAITYVRAVDEAAGYDLSIRQAPEDDDGLTGMLIETPIQAYASEDQAETRFINVAVLPKINGVHLDDPTPEQLSECGFDTPKELWLENSDGQSVHYTFGDIVGTNGYVMVEGLNTILTAERVYTAMFEVKYTDVMFKMLLQDGVADVAAVDYSLEDGTQHRLEVDYTPPPGENTQATVLGTLDGEGISSTNVSRLYAATLNLTVYEAYEPGSVTLGAKPDITVTITLNDGTVRLLELHNINDRRYAVVLDGEELNFYVHRDTINTLKDAFGCIQRGETIPRV